MLICDDKGNEIDSSFGETPLSVIQGIGFVLEGLDDALVGHVAGDKFDVKIDADNAYGQHDEGHIQVMPKEMFAEIEKLEVGGHLHADTDQGEQSVVVTAITDDEVTIDGNHPLAGLNLEFKIEVLEVRDATEDELSHGHVHSEGGCGHNH